jgi:hypothetical protein
MTTITLPYRDLSYVPAHLTFTATAEVRFDVLGKVFEDHDRSLDEVPEAWKDGPLRAWCWLVLTLNDIDFEDDNPKPLVSYGIDLMWASREVNAWVFFLA